VLGIPAEALSDEVCYVMFLQYANFQPSPVLAT